MSIITVSVFVLLMAGGCFGSWKGALYWQNRTRDARKEDPRDQEIRELSAALSIARKDSEKLGKSSSTQDHEIAELRIKLQKLTEVLTETRHKFNAAQDSLSKEIEQKSELDAKVAVMHRELNETKSRNAELELRVKIDSPTSGLVAGLDDTMEDDEKEVFTIRHEHKILKERVSELQTSLDEKTTESQRWKQHCTVMTKTNKTLRSSVDDLNTRLEGYDEIKAAAERLPAALDENRVMETELNELRNVRDENTELKVEVDDLNANLQATSAGLTEAQSKNVELQAEVEKLSAVHDENAQLQTLLADIQQQLSEVQQEAAQLQAQVTEMRGVHDENTNLKARINELQQIETDNSALRSQLRQESLNHSAAIEQARKENEELAVRLEALDNIQAENERLLQQSKELRQTHNSELQARQEQIQTLETQCAELNDRVAVLGQVEEDNGTLRDRISELEGTCQNQAAANSELGSRIDKLSQELQEIPQLRARAEELSKDIEAGLLVSDQLEESKQAHAEACAEIEQLKLELSETCHLQATIEQNQARFDELHLQLQELDGTKQELNEKLAQTQSEKDGLSTDLHGLQEAKTQTDRELEILRDTNADLLARIENFEAQPVAVSAAPPETVSEDTDRLPVLDASLIEEPDSKFHDDLKAIRGVGAKIEQKLNMLGIVNFKDLAELGADDYERAADLIPNLESRMKRYDWTSQARELHREKYSETI
ncbi:MAG: hypothetical protein P8Y61_00290 [Gammaproteobacteria bacterium]|jgi:predicted flap endonuclease-1-like 5' DNA nuclease